MSFLTVTQVLGGLAVFLFGIDMLSAGMEEVAGRQIQRWLERMTNHPMKAALFGTIATTILQSSSLLMVTMIGLINANLFTLEQVVGVILGQEIGTTLTGQLVAFNIGNYLFGLLILGYVLQTFGGEKRWEAIGKALLGVGLIFLGLETMKSGVKPLTEQPWIQSAIVSMGHVPALGVLAGALLTAAIQSSSATTGLIIAMGVVGAITLPAAIAIILGANIGTCVTGFIASLRAVKSARRASVAQILINLFGAALFFPFIAPYSSFISRTSSSLARQIANAHSVFNVLVSLLVYPFTRQLVALCKVIVPGEDKRLTSVTQFLDDNLLGVPSIALTQAANEVTRMAKLAAHMLILSKPALIQMDEAAIQEVLDCEHNQIDPLCAVIEQFVNRILRGPVSEDERHRCFQLKSLVTDIERVADMTENLAQAGQERLSDHIDFSPDAEQELIELHGLVYRLWSLAIEALATGDKSIARTVVDEEERFDVRNWAAREAHGRRLEAGICTPKSDILFVETLRNLERIGDHADNLGVSVLRS
jgi:phosphate:Na+ symporter